MTPKYLRPMLVLVGLGLIAAPFTAAAVDKKYSTGASDTEIKVGHSVAYSGPASAFGATGRTLSAYFRMLNEAGGISGRKINFMSLDDAYSPAKALEQTRKLVEGDGVLLMSGVTGTPTNSATQKYLNSKGVPQILLSTGATKFNNPKDFPWTMAFWPSYDLEQKIFADYILKTRPGARIAVLYANDDFGKTHLNGLKAALAGKSGASIVAEAAYETSDPTIDSQIVALKASGADVFVNASTPKFTAQAIRRAHEIGWAPLQFVVNASSSISAVLKPAGLENAVGAITTGFIKAPDDPVWAKDKDVRDYLDFMKTWNPQDNPFDFFAAAGYLNAQMLRHVLESCGDDLTRENIMKHVANIHDVHLPMQLPHIVLKTTPDDFGIYKSLQLQRFDGKNWVDID